MSNNCKGESIINFIQKDNRLTTECLEFEEINKRLLKDIKILRGVLYTSLIVNILLISATIYCYLKH